MLGQVNVYLIWYGDWTGTQGTGSTVTVQTIVKAFVSNLGGSAWWNIMTSYTQGTGGRISNNLVFGGAASLFGSADVSNSMLASMVTNTVASGALPKDTNGIYLVIPSQNINDPNNLGASGCSSYCGWHLYLYFADGTTPMVFGFITNPY